MDNNLQADLFSKLMSSGLDITKLPDILKQVKQFIPLVKSFFPLVKEYEKGLNLKPNQKILYSAMVENDETFLYVFVIESNQNGKTEIVNQLGKITMSEGIEKITSILPF